MTAAQQQQNSSCRSRTVAAPQQQQHNSSSSLITTAQQQQDSRRSRLQGIQRKNRVPTAANPTAVAASAAAAGAAAAGAAAAGFYRFSENFEAEVPGPELDSQVLSADSLFKQQGQFKSPICFLPTINRRKTLHAGAPLVAAGVDGGPQAVLQVPSGAAEAGVFWGVQPVQVLEIVC